MPNDVSQCGFAKILIQSNVFLFELGLLRRTVHFFGRMVFHNER